MIKKIVLIGPESTGKSTLGMQLAEYYQTLFCPEFAREYLKKHGKNYTYDDLLAIAKGQIALEDQYTEKVANLKPLTSNNIKHQTSNIKPLFVDTDMYVMKVWCEFVFNSCHQYILDQIVERKYDLYFLCNNDIPWVKDPLREYPDTERRKNLLHIYKDILVNQDTPWVEISGGFDERLKKAIAAVDRLIKQ